MNIERVRALLTGPRGRSYHIGLMLGLIHVFAMPKFSAVLIGSGAYSRDAKARHDVTVRLLDSLARSGFDDPSVRAAISRMNRAHHESGLTAQDMRYGLAVFVVFPAWWAEHVDLRPYGAEDLAVIIAFYRRLGTMMGVTDLPATLAELTEVVDDYERTHLRYSANSERLIITALEHLVAPFPSPLRKRARIGLAAVLDDNTRTALGVAATSASGALLVRTGLRLHGRLRTVADRLSRYLPARQESPR